MSSSPQPSPPPAILPMASHILAHLPPPPSRPLLVGIQGPQGSGKTFLTSSLRTHLSAAPHSLRVCVLSIDDLYLPHAGLQRVAEESGGNAMLRGRGLPGTHDVPLGSAVLRGLKEGAGVELPVFEKSLFGGEGDRVGGGESVVGRVDVVLFEGWCVGFGPLTRGEVQARWAAAGDVLGTVSIEDVAGVSARLAAYVAWWQMLHVFIQITPRPQRAVSRYSLVYKWRLEQEHNMKARNGGEGMSDEAVKAFVDRYIPGYLFFADGITDGWTDPATGAHVEPPWKGRGLRVLVGEEREVVGVETF